MEINNSNNNIAGLFRQDGLYHNGAARVREVGRIDPATFHPSSAVYHGSKEQTPSVGYEGLKDYSISVESKVSESAEELGARIDKMLNLLFIELGDDSHQLKLGYDAALEKLSPELRQKDWGFSVSKGYLVLWENKDELSESERVTIKTALLESGVDYLADNVSDTLVAGLKAERGPDETTGGVGRYNLTKENFGEIIDLRAYLESHMKGGDYDWKVQHLNSWADPNDLYGGRSGLQAMVDQMAARAEAPFAD